MESGKGCVKVGTGLCLDGRLLGDGGVFPHSGSTMQQAKAGAKSYFLIKFCDPLPAMYYILANRGQKIQSHSYIYA